MLEGYHMNRADCKELVSPALGPEGIPAQDERQHGTLIFIVYRFFALRGEKTIYKELKMTGRGTQP
jgi:hypothetical protein